MELPNVNAVCMSVFLQEFVKEYPDDEIELVMDGAGWHKSKDLQVPNNVKITLLPAYSPELNPVERFWRIIKQNTIRNKIYTTLNQLKHAVAEFLNSLEKTQIQTLCNVAYL